MLKVSRTNRVNQWLTWWCRCEWSWTDHVYRALVRSETRSLEFNRGLRPLHYPSDIVGFVILLFLLWIIFVVFFFSLYSFLSYSQMNHLGFWSFIDPEVYMFHLYIIENILFWRLRKAITYFPYVHCLFWRTDNKCVCLFSVSRCMPLLTLESNWKHYDNYYYY